MYLKLEGQKHIKLIVDRPASYMWLASENMNSLIGKLGTTNIIKSRLGDIVYWTREGDTAYYNVKFINLVLYLGQ